MGLNPIPPRRGLSALPVEEQLKLGYIQGRYDVEEFEAALHCALRGLPIDENECPNAVAWLLPSVGRFLPPAQFLPLASYVPGGKGTAR